MTKKELKRREMCKENLKELIKKLVQNHVLLQLEHDRNDSANIEKYLDKIGTLNRMINQRIEQI